MPAKLQIACRVASYRPFEAVAFEHLQQIGVRHVEIPVPEASALDDTAATLERFGLSATTLHGRCDLSRPDPAEQIAAQAPAFAVLGTRLFFTSVKAGDTPFETACARLRAAGAEAAKHGLTIVVETHPDLATNAEVANRTMQAVDHPHVRLNFDTANVYFYNHGADAVADLRAVVDYVDALHLKDTDGAYRNWHFPALGAGVVDFPAIFEVLDQADFAGPCTLEIEGIEREERTEELVRQRIEGSVEYLRRIGRC